MVAENKTSKLRISADMIALILAENPHATPDGLACMIAGALESGEAILCGQHPEIPRRNDVWRMSRGEIAIRNAIHVVESMGAHERLTSAVALLDKAQNAVADFVDSAA